MKVGAQVAIGVAVGYLLGRTRKGRLALTLAAAGATGKLAGNPRQLIKHGASLLGSSPELKSLTDDVRGRLVDAGKAAAVSATSGRINALTSRLEERTEALRRPRMPGKAGEEGEEEERDREEPYDEDNEELLDEEDVEADEEEEPRAEDESRRRPAASRGERPRRSTASRGSTARSPVRRSAVVSGPSGTCRGSATERGGLTGELQNLAGVTATWAVSSLATKLDSATDRLTDYAENGRPGGLLAAATGGNGSGGQLKTLAKKAVGTGLGALNPLKKSSGKGGKGKQPKVTNIVETIDVGVPLRLAYDQWTRFTEFPSFTKKVENVEQESDEKLVWRAKIFWSAREWESTIIDQVPDERVVWRSKGAKGHVDGAVTFHELAPNLTRIILVLEYHPQGLFEKTGNIWRAQGRRARLELKHFRRHAMTQSLLHPDEVEGWRGEIRDGEVVSTGEADSDSQEDDGAAADDDRAGGRSGRREPKGCALIEDEATVKRYFPEGDRIRFQPANKDMEPIYVKKTDFKSTQLLGQVVGVYRRLNSARL